MNFPPFRALLIAAAILVAACTPHATYPGLPVVYGNVKAVSADDIRASIAAYDRYRTTHADERIPALPIVFVRVLSADKLQLHYNPHADSPDFEGYAEMEKRSGKWNYEGRVLTGIHE